MIFGLPISTFILAIGLELVAVVIALMYGIRYDDTDRWWTLEDWTSKEKDVSGHE